MIELAFRQVVESLRALNRRVADRWPTVKLWVEVVRVTSIDRLRAVNLQPGKITLDGTAPTGLGRQLMEFGFVILPGAVSARRLDEIRAAYDELIISGSGPDFNVGSTTTRLYFVNITVNFEDVYQYPPLLETSAQLVGPSFMLSSLLGRTLRAASPAQELHADISRDCADAPMAGFILMLDSFTRTNGATRFIPGSQNWPDVPSDRLADRCSEWKARFWPVEMPVRSLSSMQRSGTAIPPTQPRRRGALSRATLFGAP